MILGLWYNVTYKNDLHINKQIYDKMKIVPSHPELETDPQDKMYYHVVVSNRENPCVCIPFTGSVEECEAWIKDNYSIDEEQTPINNRLVHELEHDVWFLKREAHSKCWEIALHIEESLKRMNFIEESNNG